MTIIVGTPFHPNGAFVFDKFLTNQKQIQERTPDSELVLAISMPELKENLEKQLHSFGLRGKVITYTYSKPEYAVFRIWDIAAARDAIRLEVLSRPDATGLLFADSDMLFDPEVINILMKLQNRYDVVYSGYRLKDDWLAMSGFGCVLLSRKALQKVHFRCYEFRNGDALCEDEVLEYDLNLSTLKVKKGVFLTIDHFSSSTEYMRVLPQKIPLINRVVNLRALRIILVFLSLAVHRNVSFRTKNRIHRIIHPRLRG